MTPHELLSKANAAKASGDYEVAIHALTELITKGGDDSGPSDVELGLARMERAQCYEHLDRLMDAYVDYGEASLYASPPSHDDAEKTISLRLSELCRKMDDELWAVMFGVEAILAEALLRTHQERGEALERLETQIDERVDALLGPAVDDAKRTALQNLVHEYIGSAYDEQEFMEEFAQALGVDPSELYGAPISGRRI
jgi:tetratricopeptide (TPR) repeat protein